MKLKITISVDDVMPGTGYRIIGEPAEKWMRQLNEEFGAKFDLFCPSNWHGEYPISKNKEWVKELNSIEWLELAAHGDKHQCQSPQKFGEMEFAELQYATPFVIENIRREWKKCGMDIREMGWRNPGWICSEVAKKYLEETFKYAAIHHEHNRGMKWNCPTFFGHDGIHSTDISIHNISEANPGGMIMFQSHIAGNHNDNVWNESNYEQLRFSLTHLVENYDCEFKCLNECL